MLKVSPGVRSILSRAIPSIYLLGVWLTSVPDCGRKAFLLATGLMEKEKMVRGVSKRIGNYVFFFKVSSIKPGRE